MIVKNIFLPLVLMADQRIKRSHYTLDKDVSYNQIKHTERLT